MKVRTRFSPSPTGHLHVGNIRTALYSWLFARHHNGRFILRIEDTDFKRSTPKMVRTIIESMKWLHLIWDEGPYFQSKRFNLYNKFIDKMLKTGTAYKCYCSKERLESLRKKQIEERKKPRYDGQCRYNYQSHSPKRPYVIRFANPQKGSVIFNDQIHGLITFKNNELDDLIIRRTDGTPTYNFCVAIDDWDMEITHVIRGEDHINNTPRQINILKALGAPIPIYAHISMINNENRKKLSKRHSATNIIQFQDEGYLPEALLNYLVRLGWSNGNQEIFSRKEMIKNFSLNKVSKSPSSFNIDKLLWLNQHYINTLPIEYVASQLKFQIEKINLDVYQGPQLSNLIQLMGNRCKTLKEIAEKCHYLYKDSIEIDQHIAKKYLHLSTRQPIELIRDKLILIKNWTTEEIYLSIRAVSDELKIGMKSIWMVLRVILTGTEESPAVSMIIYIIGKIRTLIRINKALEFITNYSN